MKNTISHPAATAKTPHAIDLPSTDFRLKWVDSADDLASWVSAWERLAATCVEANVFFEPAMLLPAFEELASSRVRFALVVASPRQNGDGAEVLCGLFPTVKKRGRIELWKHPYAFQGAPLVRAEVAAEVCAFFLREVVTGPDAPAGILRCANLRAEGPVARHLTEAARRQGCGTWIQAQGFRAAFRPAATADEFTRLSVKRKVRRNLARERRLLEERGEVATAAGRIDPNEVDAWANDFLRVESSGWKGRMETALNHAANDREWFLRMMRAKSERGQLLGASVRLDGKPLAMGIMLEAAPTEGRPDGPRNEAAYFKIAFVESYADVSLGGLLQLAWLETLHGDPRIDEVDSCAIPGHPLIERFWPGRTMVQTTWISRGSYAKRLLLWLFQGAYSLKEARRSKS